MHRVDVLFCDVLPFKHSTRTRKLALALADAKPSLSIEAATLRRVGRTGIADERPNYTERGVAVVQTWGPKPFERRSLLSTIGNLALVYGPAAVPLVLRVLTTRSRVLVLGSTSLAWVGYLHQKLYGSYVVLNARERLGGVRTAGSLGTLVSRLEIKLTRYIARRDVMVVCVCDGHAKEFAEAGARKVSVVRNVPERSFIPARLTPIPSFDEGLRVVLVGSLYPGRGIEALIDACGELRTRGTPISLLISGRAGSRYLRSLQERVASADLAGTVLFLGPCEPKEVPARYADGHIGTALYEAVDPANDSLSNKIFESIASGRPVLAGRQPENQALLESATVGWTSPVEPQALADTLERIASNASQIPSLAQDCWLLSRSSWNWEVEVAPLLKEITQQLRSSPR